MRRLLVVEDSVDSQILISKALSREFRLVLAASLKEARECLSRERPDLVLLDVGLPDGAGYHLCADLQGDSETRDIPVVFLTARSAGSDKVLAFELGAEDFVEKPFDPSELRARVQARLRKLEARERRDDLLLRGPLRIERTRYRAFAIEEGRERDLELTPNEFRILQSLAVRPARVVTRAQLLEVITGGAVSCERTVDSHLCNLRRKLGPHRHWVQSVRGVGYRFASPGE